MWQKIKNIYHLAQSALAVLYYNFPSRKLTVIGVTGTDGKTTTVHMIYHILKSAGKKVGMISSLGAYIGSKVYETGFHTTTPSPWQIQRFLRKAVDLNIQYFVLEATSHGLDQNRLAHVKFSVATITNITGEHLDYHHTWQNYAKSKAKLFKNVSYSILNSQDKSYDYLKNKVDGQIITYSTQPPADITPRKMPIRLNILGNYNLENAQAAAATAQALGIPKSKITSFLTKFQLPSGRMQKIDLGQDFQVFIDFAHTPNALKLALSELQNFKGANGRLITVFGAAGRRDYLKRPQMGKVADEFADLIILTSEDPRTEKPEEITRQIALGIRNKKEGSKLLIIIDRIAAIQEAINLAQKGDVVGIFGKGHEKTMTIGKRDYPYNEEQNVKNAIRRLSQN